MKRILIAFVYLIFLFSCDTAPVKRQNEIHKIELSSGPCFGTCKTMYMIFDSSLKYQYYEGGIFSDRAGYYKGEFSQGYWDTVNRVFGTINYKNMPDTFSTCCDGAITELYIHYSNSEKQFYGMFFPVQLNNTISWLYGSSRNIKLEESDSIYFPHRAENNSPLQNLKKKACLKR